MEFEFKIIAVEKGTHSLTSEKGDKWDVDTLPDVQTVSENAPKKRVIELPAQVIHVLKHMKTVSADSVDFAMALDNYKGKTELFGVEQSVHKISDMYVSWYLGHVEFVAKKGPKFYIRVFDVFDADGNDLYLASMGNNKFRMTIYTDSAGMFTEEEADKIIADVSNSDVSLTARKVKVEER